VGRRALAVFDLRWSAFNSIYMPTELYQIFERIKFATKVAYMGDAAFFYS
jgi:hypothetical protein